MQGFQYTGGEPQQQAPKKPSGCSTIALLAICMFLFAGGGAAIYYAKEHGMSLSTPPEMAEGNVAGVGPGGISVDGWTGQTTLECTGADNITLNGRTVAATASPAIRATGACTVTLVGSTITAPVVIEATGGSHVTITGGAILGTVRAIDASGGAHVDVVGATVTGAVVRSGGAVITGVAK